MLVHVSDCLASPLDLLLQSREVSLVAHAVAAKEHRRTHPDEEAGDAKRHGGADPSRRNSRGRYLPRERLRGS
jgi:hypothetical protein